MTRLPSPALFLACGPQAAPALSLCRVHGRIEEDTLVHVTGWMLLLPAAPPAEPQRVRQGRMLNKGLHTDCSLESQTSSSDCRDFIAR